MKKILISIISAIERIPACLPDGRHGRPPAGRAGTKLALSGFILFLLISCAPEMMKVTVTKNGASVSTIMPYDLRFKRSLKDSINVKVETIKNQ